MAILAHQFLIALDATVESAEVSSSHNHCIYRDDWWSIIGDAPFETSMASVDIKVLKFFSRLNSTV